MELAMPKTPLLLLCCCCLLGAVHGFCDADNCSTFNKMLRQFLGTQPHDLKLGDGVYLVDTDLATTSRSARDDGSILGAMQGFLQARELRIRLPEFMPGQDFNQAFKTAMQNFTGRDAAGGRQKGNKGGGGGLLMAALLMGKTLAAVGFGSVGMLAMKALMVSMLALMLSSIIGLKKLVSSGHDDHGGHTVIHASSGHDHRRRRDALQQAYKAWIN